MGSGRVGSELYACRDLIFRHAWLGRRTYDQRTAYRDYGFLSTCMRGKSHGHNDSIDFRDASILQGRVVFASK
jgi:hypothetical protein